MKVNSIFKNEKYDISEIKSKGILFIIRINIKDVKIICRKLKKILLSI